MKYVRAQTAAEALQALLRENGRAQIIAGGSDLMVEMREGKCAPEVLVDITFASDIKEIKVEGNELVIGAAVTIREVAGSSLVKQYFPSLSKAAGKIGSPQIRNSATLIGNVVSGEPGADGAMALAPLAPQFVILSASGVRTMSIGDLYIDFSKTIIDAGKEVVTEVRIPLPAPDEAASYVRLELRKSLCVPMLNVAAMLRYSGDQIQWARITMGQVGVGPTRARAAEDFLAGKALTVENAAQAGVLALQNARPVSNPLRGTKEYSEEVLPVLVRRALEDIAAQLGVM
ncbi:MAG: FAD binding domain-containing protein [Firmicutes bacterium]|nr:FAD binding domain-containing protein [Bacillota bacterium]